MLTNGVDVAPEINASVAVQSGLFELSVRNSAVLLYNSIPVSNVTGSEKTEALRKLGISCRN